MIAKEWEDKFNRELRLKRRSVNTIESYNSFYDKFVLRFKDVSHPKHISASDIKDLMVTIDNPSSFKQMLATLKFFYKNVVKQPEKLDGIKYQKINSKLPEIIGREELWKRINAIKDVRYKAIFTAIGMTGLRVSECARLKLEDFNKTSNPKTIIVREGKGKKDRQVPYGDTVRQALKEYFPIRKNSQWLFCGENPNNYISTSTIERQCRLLLKMHPHQLRHCYAVHFLESGGDIHTLKNLLGHNDIETTERYSRMTNTLLSNALKLIDYNLKIAV